MSALDRIVSGFIRANRPGEPQNINMLTWLKSEKYRAQVERIRAEPDKKKRDALKKDTLPCITPSGTFTHRHEAGLIRHSGLIAGDIDFSENPYNPERLKMELSKIKNVAYCGLSASGRGLWFLVPVTNPELHERHFDAMVDWFSKFNIFLDPAPANVASARFYSFDPNAYFNHNAALFSGLAAPQRDTWKPSAAPPVCHPDAVKLEAVTREIEERRLDITGDYRTWFNLLSALATLGEDGREYAHRISRFYPEYRTAETDRQFSRCLKMRFNRFTLGTLFDMAKRQRIYYKTQIHARPPAPQPAQAANASTAAPMPTPQPGAVTGQMQTPTEAAKTQRFTDRHTGETFVLLMTPEGYPAAWDAPTPETHPNASLSAQEAAALITLYGWEAVGTWKPI